MYIYMHVCMQIRGNRMPEAQLRRNRACLHICTRTCIYMYTYLYIYMYTHPYVYIYIHIYMRMQIRENRTPEAPLRRNGMCLHIHIYIHIHVHRYM